MKKLFTLVMLMIVMSVAVTAQLATYSVVKTQLTLDETWDDFETEDATEKTILVIYNFEKKRIHITNADQSTFFLSSSENLDDFIDEEGDVIKATTLSAWDEEGLFVSILLKWWEDGDITFHDDVTTIMTVYNEDYWVRYFLILEIFRD